MKIKDGLKYLVICMTCFLLLSGFEILALNPLIDIFSNDFWIHFGILTFFILIVNVISTYFVSNKIWSIIGNQK